MYSGLNERQVKFLLKILFLSFIALITYEYISLYRFKIQHPELAPYFRPNFPFTEPFYQGGYLGDAHLLAAYISTGLLSIIFCRRYNLLKIGLPFYYILLTVVFIAMLLTGSRNGIVTFVMVIILFALFSAVKLFSSPRLFAPVKRITLYFAFAILIGGAVIIALYMNYSSENDFVTRLLRRTFYFSLSEDQSFLGRVRKFSMACDLVFNGPILIGVGLQSSPLSFFDGAISSILVSSGLIGLIIFISIIVVFFLNLYAKAVQNQRQEEFLILLFVSLNYILANLITEFFLVSRSVIPFSIFLGLVAKLVHLPKDLVANIEEKHGCFDNNSLFE
jgi:O-antigen ligase